MAYNKSNHSFTILGCIRFSWLHSSRQKFKKPWSSRGMLVSVWWRKFPPWKRFESSTTRFREKNLIKNILTWQRHSSVQPVSGNNHTFRILTYAKKFLPKKYEKYYFWPQIMAKKCCLNKERKKRVGMLSVQQYRASNQPCLLLYISKYKIFLPPNFTFLFCYRVLQICVRFENNVSK